MQYTSRDLRRYNHLLQETDAVYHEMAQHWGLPDSVMGVLYTLCDAGGRCSVREVCRLGGMSKQTVNSALRRMEREGLIYLEAAGRGKDVCLTEAGEGLACRTALRVIQAENQVFAAWPQADVEQYLALTLSGGPGEKSEGNQGGVMSKASIQLSDHFTCGRLIRFTLPSITMMIFTAVYGVVDGFFVSNYAGKTPFAAVNLIIPVLLGLGCVGFMFGTGGGALIAKTMGQGDRERANDIFSMIVYVSAAIGVVLAGLGFLILRPAAVLMGAEGELLEQTLIYGRINLIALPFYVLQYEFQCLFATAEKPRLGLFVTVAAGVANMVLDALFVAVFSWGAAGAAAATALSQFIGGSLPLVYFARPNSSLLRLGKCRMDLRALLKTCSNGSSEFMSNVSMSLVSMLYNVQLMKYAGEDGVSAYGVLMYVNMIFQAIYIGYSVGTAPIVSFHYGAGNRGELRGLLRRSGGLLAVCAVCMLAAGQVLAAPLSRLYVGYDPGLFRMTSHAFSIFSFSFLFSGFAIYGSSFFTALNDGLTSAIIAFLRALVFQVGAVLLFPLLWRLDGIWMSIVAAEVMAVAATGIFLLAKRKRYGY